jgi:Rad3-related DNA helicase
MIRSSSDWGAVVITDSRMGTKRYGGVFLDAAPSAVQIHDDETSMISELRKWAGGMSLQ